MVDINLIQGDCIEEMQKLICADVKVDMILTDIPYGTTASAGVKLLKNPIRVMVSQNQ